MKSGVLEVPSGTGPAACSGRGHVLEKEVFPFIQVQYHALAAGERPNPWTTNEEPGQKSGG